MSDRYYENKKKAARTVYRAQPLIYCPFFRKVVLLGSEGFRHLSFSSQGARSREEQIRRFIVLPVGLHILANATKPRGYRTGRVAIGWKPNCSAAQRRCRG